MRSSGIEETAKRTGADFWGAGALRVVVILIPCSHRDAAKAVRLPWLGLGSVGRCPQPGHCSRTLPQQDWSHWISVLRRL
jgi:hypothetical protein